MPYIPTAQELNAIPTAPPAGGPLSPGGSLPLARAAAPAPYVPTQSEMDAIPSVRPVLSRSPQASAPAPYQPTQAELDSIPAPSPSAGSAASPPPAPDPIGDAMNASDKAGSLYQSQPTPDTLTAYKAALQNTVNTVIQTGAMGRHQEYQDWAKSLSDQGLVTLPPAPASSAPSGFLPFAERIIGADGHEGTFHSQLDSLGSAAAELWKNLNSPSSAASPGQYADVAADSSNAEGAGDLMNRMNRENIAKAPQALADMTVPGGHAGLLAHGAEAAVQGTLPSFGKSLGPGIENETLNNPVGQMMNVVALVSAGKLPLDAGAASLLSTGEKLSAAADAAEAAGNTASAANLRGFAQKAVAAGQDMKVASTQYGRAVTGGSVGDSAMNAAATIARKHFPGTGFADDLTNAAMSRSLGKAVVDAYPGYKVMRDMDQGRITPQSGDVNIGPTGMAQTGNNAGMGAEAPPASAGSAVASLGAMQRPMLPAPSVSPPVAASPILSPALPPAGVQPDSLPPVPNTAPALPPAVNAGPLPLSLPPAPAPLSLAGKPLDPSAPLTSGAARHTDGTFAPVPTPTPLPLGKVPQASVEAPTAQTVPASPPTDARLVSGFPVSQLHLDPDRFQYKIGYGKGGSSGSLTDAKAFNPDFAGIVHAWRDPADGKAYVVNGHNRVGLAQRTGTAGIDTRFIDAPDAASARTRGALINIAEGQGTALDAAKVFRMYLKTRA